MKIGIIGSGNIGGNLARRLRQLGHDVQIANSRGPESLEDLAMETGALPVLVEEAARDNELVVVTIPLGKIPQLPPRLFEGVSDTVPVIDTCNYYPQQRDGRIEGIEGGMMESEWVAQNLGRAVIKAFNNIYADHLLSKPQEAGTPGRVALPVAGDNAAMKGIVFNLVDQLGFEPVDGGTLAESWRQQPGTPCYGTDGDADALRGFLADATPERKPEWRGTKNSPQHQSA
jgi:predicted dinucleotide-binding enzyme